MTRGRCAICGAIGLLTKDHVPPKSVMEPVVLEIIRISDLLMEDSERPVPRGGFQAPVFPSLCKDCNNQRLGLSYDPVLARFIEDTRPWVNIIERGIIIPDGISVTTKPLRLARAVVGHLLAAVRLRFRESKVE